MKFILAALVLAFTVGFASPSFAEQSDCEWAKQRFRAEMHDLGGLYNILRALEKNHRENGTLKTEQKVKIWEGMVRKQVEETTHWATIKLAACDRSN
jgi:hypothetical protein